MPIAGILVTLRIRPASRCSGVCQTDDVGAGSLRLKQVGRKVRGVDRMTHGAEHLAAGGSDGVLRILLEVLAEGIVRRDEEPSLAALLRQGAADAVAERPGVIGPVDEVRRALRPGQHRRSGTRSNQDLVLFPRQSRYGQRYGRIRHIEDDIDAVIVIPVARDVEADVRLVLMIREHDLDGHAGFRGEIIGGHLGA